MTRITGAGRSPFQGKAMLERMHRAARLQFAGEETKRFDAKRRGGEFAMGVRPVGGGGRGVFAAPAQRDMGMKRSHIEVETRCENGVVDPLAKLEQTRVPISSPNPKHLGRTTGWEGADTLDREDKRRDLHLGQSLDD